MIKDAFLVGKEAYKWVKNYRMAKWESRIKFMTWQEQEAYMEGWFHARWEDKRSHNGKQLDLFGES